MSHSYQYRYNKLLRDSNIIKLKHIEMFITPDHFSFFNTLVLNFETKKSLKISDSLYLKLIKRFSKCDDLYKCFLFSLENKDIKYPSLETEVFKNGNLKLNPESFYIKPTKNKKVKYNTSLSSVLSKSRFNLVAQDFEGINDIEKFRFLLSCVRSRDKKRQFNFTDEDFLNYINKFYFCKKFNRLYRLYLKNNKLKQLRPSLDHIVPRSLGGSNNLDNLEFITFFENCAKLDCPPSVWKKIKENIHLFID